MNFKIKKDIWFLIVAMILLVMLIIIIINNLSFIMTNLNRAFNFEAQTEPVSQTQFDIEGFESLNISE